MLFKEGKHSRSSVKIVVLVISVVLLLTATVAGTLTYLLSITPPVKNEFTPALISCEVEETFEDNVKTDVKIKNTGNTDAFIRATVVATFVKDNGAVYAKAPLEKQDYELILGSDKWVKGSDGFFYYTEKVKYGESTENLLDSAKSLGTAPEGYELSIQIVASALQNDPESVVTEFWGVQVVDGKLDVK